MLMATANQTYIFLSTIYGGIIIGFIYDIYRMIRRIFRPKKLLTGVIDLLFWLTVSVVSFSVLYYVNDGEIRAYHLLGFFLGAGIYMLILSPLVMGLFYVVYKMVCRVFKILLEILMVPVRFLWNIIKVPLHWLHYWVEPEKDRKKSQ